MFVVLLALTLVTTPLMATPTQADAVSIAQDMQAVDGVFQTSVGYAFVVQTSQFGFVGETPSSLKNFVASLDSNNFKSRIIAVCEELLWRQAFGAVGQYVMMTSTDVARMEVAYPVQRVAIIALSQGLRLPLVFDGVDQQATKRYINYHGRSSSVHRLGSTAALKFEGLAAIQPASSQVWRT